MSDLSLNISLNINEHIFLKDPESSDLGRRMVSGSIAMIEEIGFEAFTFKKLSEKINTTEASIYRYFESKYKLLQYLMAWYWAWLDYRLVFALANISSARVRLMRAIELLTAVVDEDGLFPHINETKLQHIVIAESSKVYLTKHVDEENKFGVFSQYKQIVERVSSIVLEINKQYRYPHMLVSNMVEGAHYQRFFAKHLPRLTDVVKGEDAVTLFYKDLVFKSIERSRS